MTTNRIDQARAAYARSEARKAAGLPEALDTLINTVEGDLLTVEERLRTCAATVQESVTRTLRTLDAGQHLSGSGELHQAGREFDQLCVLRQASIAHVNVVVAAARKLHPNVTITTVLDAE